MIKLKSPKIHASIIKHLQRIVVRKSKNHLLPKSIRAYLKLKCKTKRVRYEDLTLKILLWSEIYVSRIPDIQKSKKDTNNYRYSLKSYDYVLLLLIWFCKLEYYFIEIDLKTDLIATLRIQGKKIMCWNDHSLQPGMLDIE